LSLKKLEVLMMIKQIFKSNKGATKMNKWTKTAMFIGIAAYILSPADLLGGPIDDILLMVLGMMANKKINNKEKSTKRMNSMDGKRIVEADGY
jgi:uncharacterized membrane protein YkvA (DUF1232 family)